MQSTPAAYAAAFRENLDGWEALVSPLTQEQFNRRPAPGRWSVAQCLDHINGIAERYLPMLEAAVAAGGPAGRPPFTYDLRGRLFISGTAESFPRPRKTLKSMEPADGPLDVGESLAAYRDHVERFLRVLESAEGLDLARMRGRSPYLPRIPFLTFPLGALIEGTAGHEKRHLAQARRVAGGNGEDGASGMGSVA